MEELMNELRDWLNSQKRKWPEIAEDSEISYSWLQKFADGRITNPTVNRLQQLIDYRDNQKTAA